MASRRKRHQSPPMSLFSFQDIITCVTGIFVLITLLLSLELLTRMEVSGHAEDITAQLASLTAEKAELESENQRVAGQIRIHSVFISNAGEISPTSAAAALRSLQVETAQLDRDLHGLELLRRQLASELEAALASGTRIDEQLSDLDKQKRLAKEEAKKAGSKRSESLIALDAARRRGQLFVLPNAGDGKKANIVECQSTDVLTASLIGENGSLSVQQR